MEIRSWRRCKPYGETEVYLFVDGLFCAEQFVESALFDVLQERACDVHVGINRRLSCC